MKKLVLFYGLLMAITLFYSCDPNENDKLPEKPRAQLEAALKAWNNNFGLEVVSDGWEYLQKIEDESSRKDIVGKMTDEKESWFPSIEATDSINIATVLKISDDPTISSAKKEAWKKKIDDETKVGQHVVKVAWKWKASKKKFVTYCTLDEDKILNDNMIMNATGVRRSNSCFSYKMWWLWEGDDPANWTRGHVFTDLTPTCDSNGIPITCNKNCTSSMTAGEAEVNCKSRIVQNCCEMDYSWAWACGFKSVKVAADGFTLEIEGTLGSGGKGNGSCTRCCERVGGANSSSTSGDETDSGTIGDDNEKIVTGYREDQTRPRIGANHGAWKNLADFKKYMKEVLDDPDSEVSTRCWEITGILVEDDGSPDGLTIKVQSIKEIPCR